MIWIVVGAATISMIWMMIMSKKQATLAYKRGYQDAINNMEIAAMMTKNENTK